MTKTKQKTETTQKEPKQEKPKYTKADWLSPREFAKKYNLPLDTTKEIMQEIYKKGLLLKNLTHSPMVIRDRLSHHPSSVQANPEATHIIIDAIKTRMSK